MLEEKGLTYEMVAEFTYQLIMSKDCPLAEKEKDKEWEKSKLEEVKQYILEQM